MRRVAVRRAFYPHTQTTVDELIKVQLSVCLHKFTWLAAEVHLKRQRVIVGNADVAIVAGSSEKSLLPQDMGDEKFLNTVYACKLRKFKCSPFQLIGFAQHMVMALQRTSCSAAKSTPTHAC